MFGSLCLAAALFTAPAVSHTPGQETVYAATDKSGLYHEGDSWNYYEDGQIAADKTTLVKYNGSWWLYIGNEPSTNIPVESDLWTLFGAKGDVGPQGPQGIQGPQGASIIGASFDANGNLILTTNG